MKRCLLLMSIVCLGMLLTGCGGDKQPEQKQEGIIAYIDKQDSSGRHGDDQDVYDILIISDVDDSDISGKTNEELRELARDHDSAFYGVEPDMYDEQNLEKGIKVNAYWDGSQDDSDPSVRYADKIEAIFQ